MPGARIEADAAEARSAVPGRAYALPFPSCLSAYVSTIFTNFSAANVRQHCNTRRVAGVKAFYTSQRNYQGPDRVAFEVIWPSGKYERSNVSITVR